MKKKKEEAVNAVPEDQGVARTNKQTSKKKTKEEAPRYRNWEKDRRDRLNVAFNDLAIIICESMPPVKKIDIVTKASECIRQLRDEIEQIKKVSGLDQSLLDRETDKLKAQMEELNKRIERLVMYLEELGGERPAWVSLPPTTPAPPDLGKRPLQYSNKLNPAKVKELLNVPKKKVTKRLQNAKKRALSKKTAMVRKKRLVPKVTSMSQLPAGILLFKSCLPENTPKVVIVPPPPPSQTLAPPVILLQPPQKTQLILSKPPTDKVIIAPNVVQKKGVAKKTKKALTPKNVKTIRHSIDALCKKQQSNEVPSKEAAQPVILSQPENNAAAKTPQAETQQPSNPPNKENEFVIRPESAKNLSEPSPQSQSESTLPQSKQLAPPAESQSVQPPPATSLPQQIPCPDLQKSAPAIPIVPTSEYQQSATTSTQNKPSHNDPVTSARSFVNTQTTFTHLNQTQTHFHSPLQPLNQVNQPKEQEQVFRKNIPFTHEAPLPPTTMNSSQSETFTHLRTNILPTFSTFGEISGPHCNQTFTTIATPSSDALHKMTFTNEIFSHQVPKSMPFSQSQNFAPKSTLTSTTFSHEKSITQTQQVMGKTPQFHQQQQEQRPFFLDPTRTPEFPSADPIFIGPQPPMATIVEQPKDTTSLYPYRGDELSDSGQRNEALNTSTFSSDIFASLHVPSGHPESISPTAAFLHTFPLVSSGRNENAERGDGTASTLLQLGSLDEGNQQMELGTLIPSIEQEKQQQSANKRSNKSFPVDLYQIESEYDAEISSIMSSNASTPKRQNKPNPFQQQNKQQNFNFYQQQQPQFKKRAMAAPQKPVQKEANRPRDQISYKSNQCPTYYQPDHPPPSVPLNLPVPQTTTNFMPWNNIEPQQSQSRGLQQNFSCNNRQSQQAAPQQQQQQKEVQRPPVNWMTNDVRHDDSAANIFDFDWNKQAPLPTLIGDLALGPTPPTPRKKDSACKYSGQNFLSVSQLVEVPKEKAKRRLVNKNGNSAPARRVERNPKQTGVNQQQQQQQHQVCPDYHSITNWPAPKPSCKTVPSSYSAESLIGPQDNAEKTDNRYSQRMSRNYPPPEQNNFFPAEQQFDYHQPQYDCSSMYQPNTSFASIVTSSSSANSIVPSFGQELNLFSSSPQKSSAVNNKRRNDNFYVAECNRRSTQQYGQQSRPSQQLNVAPSAASSSSLTNFNLSTIFPEINKPAIAPPLTPFIGAKSQNSDYVIPPPPVSFNNLLMTQTPPQVTFPAPNFTMGAGIQFPVQHEN